MFPVELSDPWASLIPYLSIATAGGIAHTAIVTNEAAARHMIAARIERGATSISWLRALPPLHVLCIAAGLFVTGLLLSIHHTGETSGETCGTLLLLALLAAASVVDARTCVIPAIINGFLVAGGIVTALTGPGIAMIALAAAAYLLLAVIARLAAWLSSTTDPAIGNGDILMLAAGMLWVSPSSAFRCLLLAFAIPAVCLILLRLAGNRETAIPMAPGIAMAIAASMFWLP